MQIYYNNSIDELQETYHCFEENLRVCQERVRQCIFKLQKSGFIQVYNATVVKYGIKCRNTPCIKLAKNFQPFAQKIPPKNEKIFASTPKKFGVKPKEILTQPQKSLDHSIYIDNNKNISNKSRSSKIFNKVENEINRDERLLQFRPEQNLEQDLQFTVEESANNRQDSGKLTEFRNTIDQVQVNQALQAIIDRVDYTRHKHVADNNIAVKSGKNKDWFKRKKLADFYPLTQEDGNLLQIKSNRAFNLDSINQLLLKLAGKYSHHHFGHKKVLMDYMAKALFHELSEENTKANNLSYSVLI